MWRIDTVVFNGIFEIQINVRKIHSSMSPWEFNSAVHINSKTFYTNSKDDESFFGFFKLRLRQIMTWFRTDYKLDPETWHEAIKKRKKAGDKTTEKTDNLERQWRYRSSSRWEEQESLKSHFHKVKDLEREPMQLFIQWSTLTQATGNHHWLPYHGYLTVHSQEKQTNTSPP